MNKGRFFNKGDFYTFIYFTSIFLFAAYFLIPRIKLTLQTLPALIIFCFVSARYLYYWGFQIRAIKYRRQIELKDRIVIYGGSPRCGKSSSGTFDVVEEANIAWKILQLDYFRLTSLYDAGKLKSRDEINHYKRVSKSYNFYLQNIDLYIPCLISNQEILENGRKAHSVSCEQICQDKCIPWGTIIFLDEIGTVYDPELFRYDLDNSISDQLRLIGHFGFYLRGTEQHIKHIYKDLRNVVAYNRVITKQKPVCKPLLFSFLRNIFSSLFLHFNKGNIRPIKYPFLGYIYSFCNKVWKNIGFRFYRSRIEENTEQNTDVIKRHFYYALPSALNCKYDDTYCVSQYKADEQELYDDRFEFSKSLVAQSDLKNAVLDYVKKKLEDNQVDKTYRKEYAKTKAKYNAKDDVMQEKKQPKQR